MKYFKIFLVALATILFATAGTAIAKQEKLPEVTVDGLHRVPYSNMAIVYAEPGADLAQFQRIKLLDAYVAFRKNWERDQRSSAGLIIPARVSTPGPTQ